MIAKRKADRESILIEGVSKPAMERKLHKLRKCRFNQSADYQYIQFALICVICVIYVPFCILTHLLPNGQGGREHKAMKVSKFPGRTERAYCLFIAVPFTETALTRKQP